MSSARRESSTARFRKPREDSWPDRGARGACDSAAIAFAFTVGTLGLTAAGSEACGGKLNLIEGSLAQFGLKRLTAASKARAADSASE